MPAQPPTTPDKPRTRTKKAPDALTDARRIRDILKPFSPDKRKAILDLALAALDDASGQ